LQESLCYGLTVGVIVPKRFITVHERLGVTPINCNIPGFVATVLQNRQQSTSTKRNGKSSVPHRAIWDSPETLPVGVTGYHDFVTVIRRVCTKLAKGHASGFKASPMYQLMSILAAKGWNLF
jgi:hypothetical protein